VLYESSKVLGHVVHPPLTRLTSAEARSAEEIKKKDEEDD
jgi:hypothetical protein